MKLQYTCSRGSDNIDSISPAPTAMPANRARAAEAGQGLRREQALGLRSADTSLAATRGTGGGGAGLQLARLNDSGFDGLNSRQDL